MSPWSSISTGRLLPDPPLLPVSELERVQALLDPDMMDRLGWDSNDRILRPPETVGQLVERQCMVDGCTIMTSKVGSLCTGCRAAFVKSGSDDMAEYASHGLQRPHHNHQSLCLVCRTPGHERPARAVGLCAVCGSRRRERGQSVAAFVAGDSRFPPATPRPTMGRCLVDTCDFWADQERPGLCNAHLSRWYKAGKPELGSFATTTGPKHSERRGQVNMQGLSELAVAEVLFCAQSIVESGGRLYLAHLRSLTQMMRACGAESVRSLDTASLLAHHRRFVDQIVARLALTTLTVEGQRGNDTLDLRAWGKAGTLSFVGSAAPSNKIGVALQPITQRWLRDAAEAWVFHLLPKHRSLNSAHTTIKVAGIWSSCLRRRPDGGDNPSVLGRADVLDLLEYFGMLARSGEVSEYARCRLVERFGSFVAGARKLGLTRSGGCLDGLPEEVALWAGDVPPRPTQDREDEIGEAIPDAVIAQILASFDGTNPGFEARVRLALGTGRRPGEICALPLVGCLDYDTVVDEATGEVRRSPVLLHDMPKVNSVGCRLPLSEVDAQIVRDQQDRVRARYPEADEKDLPLFPRWHKNFHGTEGVSPAGWGSELRRWVDPLELFDGVLVGNDLVVSRDGHGNPIRYPSSKVQCYAFRHTYAQRHIDRGTDIEVLCELLGHKSLDTTKGYYRIKAAAKRKATDRMLPFQVAVSGPLRLVEDVSSSDRLRRGVGRISVLMGWCEEPSNVKAEGTACPMRHRCFGCVHFRTDPSFLVDLRHYLATMLADKERLAAAVPGLAEWARRDAVPSDGEIGVVRRLIADCEARLVGLDPVEHSEVLEAMDLLARTRTALDDVFPLLEQGQVSQSVPVAFPRVAAGR